MGGEYQEGGGIDELLPMLVIQLFIGGWVLGGREGMTNSFLGWWGVLGRGGLMNSFLG